MFKRPHHQHIAAVLARIQADRLLENRCLFGGGTAIALANDEFRESVDINLLCDSIDGYRRIRSLVDKEGFAWLFAGGVTLERAPRVDQYGIRAAVSAEGNKPIKFEIVFEARIELAPPAQADRICGVWRMADVDLVASKLMANTDRWADDSVLSRDIIDLALMTPGGVLSPVGQAKAERAYGESIGSAFAKAKAALLERAGRLKKCTEAMGMALPESEVRERIRQLRLAPMGGATGEAPPPSRPAHRRKPK